VLLVRPVQTLAAFGIFLFAAGAAGARSSLWIYRIPEGVANRAIRWMARVSLALAAGCLIVLIVAAIAAGDFKFEPRWR
jgi:hypothetical protein